jgi:hypothetical protein
MIEPLEFGDLVLQATDEVRAIQGETAGRVPNRRGDARIFDVRREPGLSFEVGDITWDNGERDVRVVSRHDSPELYDVLKERLRLGVLRHGDRSYVELSQARLRDGRWANLYKAGLDELSRGAGADVKERLLELGAHLVDTRQVAFNERGPRQGYVCALFGESARLVPVASFLMARIAPIANGVTTKVER